MSALAPVILSDALDAPKQGPPRDLDQPLTEDFLKTLVSDGFPSDAEQETFIAAIIADIPRLSDAALALSVIQNDFLGLLSWRVKAALDAERMARVRQAVKAPCGRGKKADAGIGQTEALRAELQLRGGSESHMRQNARIHALLEKTPAHIKKYLPDRMYVVNALYRKPKIGPKPDSRSEAQKKADREKFQLDTLARYAAYKQKHPNSTPIDAKMAVEEEDAKLEHEACRLRNQSLPRNKRIIHCGDALILLKTLLKARRLIPKSVRLILIDPPFGLNLGKIKGDELLEALNFLRQSLLLCIPLVADDAHLLVFCSWKHYGKFVDIIRACGWTVTDIPFVWHKTNMGLGQNNTRGPGANSEICIYAYRGNARLDPRIDNIIDAAPESDTGHPDQKPIALLELLIEITTQVGDIVLDFCCGSGSTLVAALQLGRKAIGIEYSRIFRERALDRLHRLGLI